MKKAIALALALALGTGLVQADEKRADEKKSEKAKAHAKKKEHSAEKSDKNVFQKTESSIGKWARENKVWGTPHAGDKK